ncbi:hypothetical protein DD606_25870 [Enterobacter cloacae complex sp. GF14B]|nr:hypothetical protein DD606_25870 [Enterobacter cloacae complex sp. GF14B]
MRPVSATSDQSMMGMFSTCPCGHKDNPCTNIILIWPKLKDHQWVWKDLNLCWDNNLRIQDIMQCL